jgi:hypothetical protein
VYYRDYDGVWTMPAVTETSVANNSNWVGAIAVTRTTSSYTWNTPTISTVGGAFNTATTAYTDTSAASFTTHSGGFLISGTCLNDNVTSSSPAITQTGATIGTVTERCDGGTSTGFVVAGQIHTAPITTGASATITQTQTLSAASQGETVFIEQTETAPAAAISTLVDNFNTGTTPDAAKWTASLGSPALTSGNLVMPASSTLDALAAYNFTSDGMYVQAKGVAAGVAVGAGAAFIDVGWQFNSSSQAEVVFDGSPTGITRTHTSGDWYRLRESGGSFFLDYSTNGTSWTNLSTQSTSGYPVTAMNVRFQNTGASSATFDNFNATTGTAWTGDAALTVTAAPTGAGARTANGDASLAVTASPICCGCPHLLRSGCLIGHGDTSSDWSAGYVRRYQSRADRHPNGCWYAHNVR